MARAAAMPTSSKVDIRLTDEQLSIGAGRLAYCEFRGWFPSAKNLQILSPFAILEKSR